MTPASETVLVTGAAGFLGSRLVARLAREGTRVRALDPARGPERADVEWTQGDVYDRSVLDPLAAGCDTLYHLAAHDGGDPLEAHRVEAEGALAVLEAGRAANARVVVASSWRAGADVADAAALRMRCGEIYVALHARLHGLATVALRYFPILAADEASPTTAYLSEADAVEATRLAGRAPRLAGEVVDVASGGSASVSRARELFGFVPQGAPAHHPSHPRPIEELQ